MKKKIEKNKDKIFELYRSIFSATRTLNKNNKKNNNHNEESRDMEENHIPISRLNFSGLTKEQAKLEIDKLIEEKIERIAKLELSEMHIDTKERDRLRAQAEERSKERRRKKHQHVAIETIVTEEGVFSDYKSVSVFDIIKPEEFPEEETFEPIEGQISFMDNGINEEMTLETKKEASIEIKENFVEEIKQSHKEEFAEEIKQEYIEEIKQEYIEEIKEEIIALATYDLQEEHLAIEKQEPEDHLIIEHQEIEHEKAIFNNGSKINTKVDEAIDRVFDFYGKAKSLILQTSKKARVSLNYTWRKKLMPKTAFVTAKILLAVRPAFIYTEKKLGLIDKTKKISIYLVDRERKISERAALIVIAIDIKLDKLTLFTKEKVAFFVLKFNKLREYAELNKRKIILRAGIAFAALAVVMMGLGSLTAYEYVYNGKVLGVVKNQEDVYKTVELIGNKLSTQYDAEITIDKDKDISFNKIIALGKEVDNTEDILNRLTYMRDMKANGHGIYVNGELVAILDNEESAKEILSTIQARYLQTVANIKYNKIGFAESVQIKDIDTKLGNIQKKEDAIEYMMTGATEKKIHYVQSGETFSEIAKMYGLKQSELSLSNPEVVPAKLKIGQEICLNQIVPVVTVQTVEVATYNEVIPYAITYENTNSLYKKEQTVKSRGSNGEKQVVAEITRNNGIETSKKELSSVVITQPVSQVVLVGTKEPPPLIGTGNLNYPIRGKLTSRYGSRWGRLHSGIDLAASTGTRIGAADGGKVIFSGYNGSLGYMVKIDHGGGVVTLYGHCSKLFVKAGDRVYQGQHIANVGNTGRSTGPHVHFEVHINGKTKNPLNYL